MREGERQMENNRERGRQKETVRQMGRRRHGEGENLRDIERRVQREKKRQKARWEDSKRLRDG